MDKPDFIIVGTVKGATTSLYRSILNHPKIAGPVEKELNYFVNETKFKLGLEWYLAQFPEKPEGGLLCEATPNYITSVKFLHRIKNQLGNIKLICTIRNPVDRLISQYKHFRAMNVIFNDPEKKQDIISKYEWAAYIFDNPLSSWRGEENLFSEVVNNKHNSYYTNGEYIVKIKAMEELFLKKNIHIIEFSDLINNPSVELSKLLNFLKVDDIELPFTLLNEGSFWKGYYFLKNIS
jgi:hypothetical protein